MTSPAVTPGLAKWIVTELTVAAGLQIESDQWPEQVLDTGKWSRISIVPLSL